MTDIPGLLRDVALSCPQCTKHRERMKILLQHFAEMKLPLSTCADRSHLDRSVETLKDYAREFGLSFPDYVPVALRPKKKKQSAVLEA